ncbi:MAG TPA: hypothetical protein VET90_01945 [Candidatus Binatus sp.]|nr:hypothetical protein [Candidatus Binatus sp.]
MQPSASPRAIPRCNIGEAEIARRRRTAVVLSGVTAAVAVALVGLSVPHLARLALWPFAAAAGVTWLQVTNRFCVAFGAAGLENFGPLGAEHRVAVELAAADRRRAMRLTLEGAFAGLLVTLLLVVLPL